MAKRKFQKDEDEDAQDEDYLDEDQDYLDDQGSDDDHEPSSADDHEEDPSISTHRVTRSRSTITASHPRHRYSEEDQEHLDDDGSDPATEDNTEAADDPKVSNGGSKRSSKARSTRERKTGPTKYCGIRTPFIKKPEKAKRSGGDFFCPICDSSFTRSEGVNYHFPGCVEKYGNPQGYSWSDHPSCSSKKVAKEGPASKKRRTENSSISNSSKEVAQAQAPSLSNTLTIEPRLTRSRQAQLTTGTQAVSQQSVVLTRPRASQPKSRAQPKTKVVMVKSVKTSQKTPKPSTARPKPAKTGRRRRQFCVDESLPPLSTLDAIFHDLVSRAWELIPLEPAIHYLSTKQIHIATMCSGTESPLLAMNQIQDDLRVSGKPTLNVKHLFSAEISPYKQAYIERNFKPTKLFRDILEVALGGEATTAYGALTSVPSDVDILVAGFSCVDFSKLNSQGKKLTDIGESGDTFRAVLQYAKMYRPAVIILENVDGAPWDLIKAIWQNDREVVPAHFEKATDTKDENEQGHNAFWDDDDPAYSAVWHRVDSKHYYIPHTRTRRYMICLDRRRFSSPKAADNAAQDWKRYMIALERKASVSVEAFLLPEDDPRLQRAKDEMSKIGKPREARNWEVCNGRHEAYRTEEKLGIARPILHWTNDGAAKPSSYIWTEWILSQVERVWDSIEVSYLRGAVRGFDSFFKSRFWELSQNIDRFTDETPPGVIGCLTPTGQPFSTIRGRPITGLEAIALQGLPIDVLLLTRESQRELFELAGNAMTSTVVGAALLSALTVSHKILTRTKMSASQPLHDASSKLKEMRLSELQQSQVLEFGGSEGLSLDRLCKMAKASIRLCHCEGQSLTAPALIRKCKSCHHHCCERCGNHPKHNYQLLRGNEAPLRIEPQEFKKRLSCAIPTRLEIDSWEGEFGQELSDQLGQDWRLFSLAFFLALKQEYRYESAKRSYCWTIVFDAAISRLELIFDQEDIYWLLYGKPSPSENGDSRVRQVLQQPLARLTVRGNNMQGDYVASDSLLDGCWEIRFPVNHTFSVTITPKGGLTDSWEKSLGLESEEFMDKQVFTSLHVARTSDSASDMNLDHRICGTYDLLEHCGTASSSLHKKRPATDGRDAPLFLFLDPDRTGPSTDDCYVFSTHKQRLDYGESRQIVAKIDSKWRPPYKNSRVDFAEAREVECTVFGRWILYPLVLRPHKGEDKASSRFPKGEISMPIFGANRDLLQSSAHDIYGCLHEAATTALLSCEVPRQLADSVGWQVGHWTIIDQKSERQIAAAFAWLFARVKDLGGFTGDWRSLNSCPKGYQKCSVCAPEPPKIMWTCSRSTAKKDKIMPYEDGRQAGEFERRIKARPAPFLVETNVDADEKRTGRLRVGLHLPTLVHRALARLGNIADSDNVEIKWRLDTRFEAPTRYKLKEFTLTNNKLTLEAEYDFPTGEKLRPEQKRSLQWMIGQEADDMAFYEEEIEEAPLSQLGWRAEVRVRRSRIVRGGVLADEVGYGKTATTLALIDALKGKAEEYAELENLGCISVKATLIIVPPHLVHQWKGQARKFLGIDFNDDEILVIENINDLVRTSIKRIRKAVIVIASWKILSSPAYMARMSHFAALPEGPSSGEREIDAWLTRACGNIKKHVGELVHEYKKPAEFATALQLRLKEAHNDKDILRDVPTQRLKGARYTTWNPAECVTPKDPSPTGPELKSYFNHMEGCRKVEKMTGILLHMFDFHRIVVDEYTYVDSNQQVEKLSSFITTIDARSRWVLSGTPMIQDFGDVRNLASFLAYDLGVVDDTAGVIKGATIRRIRENRTAAEQFRAFGYSHTAAWHISRQAHAQIFLDKYASKNVAEIAPIESRLHLRPHLLGTIEIILNAELQQQLQSTDMTIVLHGKTKEDNDRAQRYKDLLHGCNTASECLLKACSYFDFNPKRSVENELSEDAMDVDYDDSFPSRSNKEKDKSSDPASVIAEDCQALISLRKKQMESFVVDLDLNLLHATWLEQQCERATEKRHRGAHYRQWKSEIERNSLRDLTASSDLRRYLDTALRRVDAHTEEIYYRDPPTKKELEKEKKAADERKKLEKDKKSAAKKAKNTKKSKATTNPDEDSAGMVVSDDQGLQADEQAPDPPDPRSNKISKDDFETYNGILRKLTGRLRKLATELTSRTRSLRFARGAFALYQWHTSLSEPLTCMACGKLVVDDKIIINISCGHLTCEECIHKKVDAECAVNGCGDASDSFRMRKAVDLVGGGETGKHGSKLTKIIALINSLPKDEQVLLFVQFEDLMPKIASALEAANISNYALNKQGGRAMNRMMNDFQENQGEDKKKVLILNPSSETAAGINLTNANHVIFMSPLLTSSKSSYNASMTQSIGRAKRFGQHKTVHVYRFLALRTIDVDILQEREEKTLVKKKDLQEGEAADMRELGDGEADEKWFLVEEDEIDETLEGGWGSGYDFKSNPTEDDD